ncbi:MAG: SDR family oxidoreductase [Pseudomonadota bacterium]
MENFTLVTGASEGIGKAFARIAARKGRKIVLTARSEDKLKTLADELDTETIVIPADLSKPGEADRLWSDTTDGRQVDFLINNAGLGYNGPFADAEAWDREAATIEVNMVAATRLMKLAVPHMQAHGERSRILNVASVAGFTPGPGMAVYHATKAYILFLSEAVAAELGEGRLTVSALCPGATESNFFDDADMRNANVTKLGPLPSAASVAQAGWDGAVTGQRVIVPGAMNKVSAALPRFLPRGVTAAMTKKILARS